MQFGGFFDFNKAHITAASVVCLLLNPAPRPASTMHSAPDEARRAAAFFPGDLWVRTLLRLVWFFVYKQLMTEGGIQTIYRVESIEKYM